MRRNYVIPMNFMETGYVLNGAVSIRNAVEAAVLGILGYFICQLLPLPGGTDAITYYIFIIAPFVLIGAYGVQGDPLSVFAMNFFRWRKQRRPYFYSTHGEAYTLEAAEMLLDAPQMRDMIADVVETIKDKMAPDEVSYVEGETFQFAEDPEQVALREAQAELESKKAEQQSKQEQPEIVEVEKIVTVKPFVKPADAKTVDAEQISQMLKLDDLDGWEGGSADAEEKA